MSQETELTDLIMDMEVSSVIVRKDLIAVDIYYRDGSVTTIPLKVEASSVSDNDISYANCECCGAPIGEGGYGNRYCSNCHPGGSCARCNGSTSG